MRGRPLYAGGLVPVGLLCILSLMDEGGRGDTSLLMVQLLLLAWGALWVVDRVSGREPAARFPAAALAMSIPLLAGIVSTALGDGGPFPSLLVLSDRSAYLLGFFLLLQLPWEARSSRLAAAGLGGAAGLLGAAMMAARLAGVERPAWPFLNPNHMAAWLAFGALLALGLRGVRSEGWWRYGSLVASLLAAGGVLATGSRGGVLALAAGAVVAAWIEGGRRLRVAVPVVLALAGVLAGIYLVRFTLEDDPYSHDRLRIWAAAGGVWLDHPVTGMGPGQLHAHNGPYQFPRETPDSVARYTRRWRSAHSTYLQVLAEEGILGAAAFGVALVFFLLALARPGPGEPGLPAAARLAPVAALLAHALVDDLPRAPALVWPALVLFAASVGPALPRRQTAKMPAGAAVAAGVVLAYAAWGAALAPWLAHRAAGDAFSGDEPVVRLERACRWNPLHAGYRRLLGNARLEAPGPSEWKGGPGRSEWKQDQDPMESLARAASDLEEAARLAPMDADVHRDLGRLQMRAHRAFEDRGSAERARRHYHRAMEREPSDPFVRLEAARAWSALGDLEGALHLVEDSLEVEPRYLRARLLGIDLLEALGRAPEARQARKALSRTMLDVEGRKVRTERDRALVDLNERELFRARYMLTSNGARP